MSKINLTTYIGLLGLVMVVETGLVACNPSLAPTVTEIAAYPPTISLPTSLAYPVSAYPPPPPVTASQAALHAQGYIAQRYDLPLESLQIQGDYPTEFLALKQTFQVVTLIDTRPQGQIYKLMVNLADNQVIEDLSALYAAEAQAHAARYGKLSPALYQRLEEISETDLITVTIWMTAPPQQSLADLEVIAIATLTAKYPEAKAAVAQGKKPMEVADPALAKQIEDEYSAIIQSQVQSRVQPLVLELEKQGFSVDALAGLPSFIATLPKKVILELNQREEVATIDLAGRQVVQESSP